MLGDAILICKIFVPVGTSMTVAFPSLPLDAWLSSMMPWLPTVAAGVREVVWTVREARGLLAIVF